MLRFLLNNYSSFNGITMEISNGPCNLKTKRQFIENKVAVHLLYRNVSPQKEESLLDNFAINDIVFYRHTA